MPTFKCTTEIELPEWADQEAAKVAFLQAVEQFQDDLREVGFAAVHTSEPPLDHALPKKARGRPKGYSPKKPKQPNGDSDGAFATQPLAESLPWDGPPLTPG